jgi:hypothetical protein
MKLKLNIGDSVVVRQGAIDPDLEEFEIGGWQGRVIEIDTNSDKNNVLITIEWDSLTLIQIPSDYIEKSEIDGFDWSSMVLYDSDLEKSVSRDNKENVKKEREKLLDKFYWASLGQEGLRISKILQGIDPHNEMKCLQKWIDHLDKELTFPIHAVVSEAEDNWLINSGDRVLIKSLPHIVDMYGVIASIRLNGKNYEFPLCDLEVTDKTLTDFQLIDDYRIWFANR